MTYSPMASLALHPLIRLIRLVRFLNEGTPGVAPAEPFLDQPRAHFPREPRLLLFQRHVRDLRRNVIVDVHVKGLGQQVVLVVVLVQPVLDLVLQVLECPLPAPDC